MTGILFTLALGFILGIKHAFEADHIIAVSTIVSAHKNPFKASLIGVFWGIGHTTTLFIIGFSVLLLKLSIPQNLSLILEGLVGVMLIILGIKVLVKPESTYSHSHKMPFLVGVIHGLAGSGALMLLVLSTIPSVLESLYYIVIFGLGSILGMSLMSFIISAPFLYTKSKMPEMERYLRLAAGVLSIIFGLFVIFSLSLGLF